MPSNLPSLDPIAQVENDPQPDPDEDLYWLVQEVKLLRTDDRRLWQTLDDLNAKVEDLKLTVLGERFPLAKHKKTVRQLSSSKQRD